MRCNGLASAALMVLVLNGAAQPDLNRHQATNDRYVEEILQRVGAQADEPAERVFKNIQVPWYRDIPARQLLIVMNLGFSRGLGVSCSHCHVIGNFASDDKREKKAARDMALMLKTISDRLEEMKHLETAPADRGINCATCHRGQTNPRTGD